MNLEIQQILTQIIAFLVMLWIMKKFAWKPLLNLMHERQEKIQEGFDGIEEEKRELQNLINEYNTKLKGIEEQARTKIQEGINEGKRIAQEIQKDSRNQAKALLSRTQLEAETEIAKAKVQLKHELVNMTLAATEKIIHRNLDDEKHRELIKEFVDKEFK